MWMYGFPFHRKCNTFVYERIRALWSITELSTINYNCLIFPFTYTGSGTHLTFLQGEFPMMVNSLVTGHLNTNIRTPICTPSLPLTSLAIWRDLFISPHYHAAPSNWDKAALTFRDWLTHKTFLPSVAMFTNNIINTLICTVYGSVAVLMVLIPFPLKF